MSYVWYFNEVITEKSGKYEVNFIINAPINLET